VTTGFSPPGWYPVQLDAALPSHVGRWRPLVLWLVTIPLLVVAYVYSIAAGVVLFLAWFAALFTGSLPSSFADFLAGNLRFTWRVNAYLLGLTTVYPSFGLPLGRPDPGGNMATVSVDPATTLSRVRVLFRYFMVIPQIVVLGFVGIAAYLVLIVSWFTVLLTGEWPVGMRNFVVGYFRWSIRVNAFYYLLTDVYPPFSLS
jgi:hypothetical protein